RSHDLVHRCRLRALRRTPRDEGNGLRGQPGAPIRPTPIIRPTRSAEEGAVGRRLKVMPGVRIGLSSRGLRVSGGPRVARVQMGAGRAGGASGLGPASALASLDRDKRATPPAPLVTGGVAEAAFLVAYSRVVAFQATALAGLGLAV